MAQFGREISLTVRQRGALAALVSSRSIKDAALEARVGERTLRRWLRQEAFRDALRDAQREVLRITLGRLQSMTTIAADTLAEMLTARSESVRVVAAKEIIQRAIDATAVAELERRVDELERRRV